MRNLKPSALSVILWLATAPNLCQAIFCQDWCELPYCTCRDLIPGVRSFFQSVLRSESAGDCVPTTNSCEPGYSGDQCRCGFSRTNIADHSWTIPDTMTGTLAITETGSAVGNLLVGTWKGGFEATSGDPADFSSWLGNSVEEENVWSVGKTVNGNELIGSHSWIKLRTPGDSTFRTVLTIGTQGGFVISGGIVYAATFSGLYTSSDEGETWAQTPTDCEPFDFSSIPTEAPGTGVPKPPDGAKYCDGPVTHMHVLDDGSLLAFYMGWGGAHLLANGNDPLLPESWEALPSFQDSTTCDSGFCHTYDAAMLGDYLYVAFQSLPMVRINWNEKLTWEQVTVGVDSTSGNDLHPTGLTTRNSATLFASTSDGLYQSTDGETWVRVADDACSSRNTPHLLSRGLVDFTDTSTNTNVLVIGTVRGPWIYRDA